MLCSEEGELAKPLKGELLCVIYVQPVGDESSPDFRTGSCSASDSQADAIEEQQWKWMQSGAAAEADTIREQKMKQAKPFVVIKC